VGPIQVYCFAEATTEGDESAVGQRAGCIDNVDALGYPTSLTLTVPPLEMLRGQIGRVSCRRVIL
jgi:hypothetical protein